MTGVWLFSYVVLWVLVAVLALCSVALLRQVGVLHARLAPLGTHPAGEGLPVGADAPLDTVTLSRRASVSPADRARRRSEPSLHLLLFTSPTCTVCRTLAPSLPALRREYPEVLIETVDLGETTRSMFDAFKVRSTPYAVLVSADGRIAGGGVANSLEQIEELLREGPLTLASLSGEAPELPTLQH